MSSAWDEELEEFKQKIDLREYAATLGYALDRRESWRNSAVMRAPSGDKIVIKRGNDGHYVYFSVRDDRDNGSIIDFVQHRKNLSLGTVRKELRAWSGRSAPSPGSGPGQALPSLPALEKTGKDRLAVETLYRRMQDAPGHPYLVEERKLPVELLTCERFAGRIRMDERRNAVFPHFDESGLCGYELKNRNFTGFATGGEKGLWFSRTWKEDARLVFAESAIDALSYAALFPDEHARYASIGGQLNPKQPGLIQAAALKMPAGAEIIAATDNDTAGHALAEMVGQAVQSTGRTDIAFRSHFPETPGADWNQVLKSRPNSFPAARIETPSPQ